VGSGAGFVGVKQWLSIVAYRCEVAGVATDSIDIQVRHYIADSSEQVDARVRAEPVISYTNEDGDVVTWPLVDLLAIEPFTEPTEGAEVIGFVTDCHAFAKWARGDAP
jgi:hypothetical protein